MKQLIIAEKPSVARSIAAVLGVQTQKNGYLENQDYLVTWCFGHLAELAAPDAYDEKFTKWRREDLPIIPAQWKYKVPREKYQQFALLKALLHRENVSAVVNACDAGREGELIFRNVYDLAGCDKPVLRLWLSSMEDHAIRDGFQKLRDGRDYDLLWAAARCRSYADWLVGINATRLFSVLYHRTLNVGRVVSPTLALLVQRDAEIKAFQPKPFYTVGLDLGLFTADSERFDEESDAQTLKNACGTAVVKTVDRKEKTEKAPALYDLTALQRDANRLLGYTAQQTLDYLQSLYEKKLCTYPRTDSRYLTDDMENSVGAIALCAAGLCDVPLGAMQPGQVCSSEKVSDHHAIIPTIAAGEADLSALPVGEREVLRLVARQVVCAVSTPHRYMQTVVTMTCGGATFTVKGKTILDMGWKAYTDQAVRESALPYLVEGQQLQPDNVTIQAGETTPPKAYTENTLLASMEMAGAEDMPEDAERKGLGTPATRAAMIEKLIATGFVERKQGRKTTTLVPTAVGVSLVTVLPEQLQSPLLTAEWENRLKQVECGELSAETFMAEISRMVYDLMKDYQPVSGAEVLFPSGREVLGKCPRCGGDVTESKKGFFCERNDCRFGLWKDNKFLTGKKISLTAKLAETLLRDGRAPVKNLFSEKTGKSYNAVLTLRDDGTRSTYGLEFPEGPR
jgi:DNA topoisomerase-3